MKNAWIIALSATLALTSGCSEEEAEDKKEKVRTPEMMDVREKLKTLEADIESLEAKLGLAADAAKEELQAEIDEKKARRKELKQEWKKLKSAAQTDGGDDSADAPADAPSDDG